MGQELLTPRGDGDTELLSCKIETREQTFSFLEALQIAQALQEENDERQ